MVTPFDLSRIPRIHFGNGKAKMLQQLLPVHNKRVLILTGSESFKKNPPAKALPDNLGAVGYTVFTEQITSEPSPAMVDHIVSRYHCENIGSVVSIGGGSVIDGGKAISAMLPVEGSVRDYLEGVGIKNHSGAKVFFVAIPTTSGTGSEVTYNAVISDTGVNGFKKSLRHINFVPDIAIVDPELIITCPKSITAASGMDAFTQLLESYVSEKSGMITDLLATDGIRKIKNSLHVAYMDGENINARSDMAYAALLSGITLANAGLGLIHGFASAIGGKFEIPHGIVCGRLMGTVNRFNIRKIIRKKEGNAIRKYAAIGRLLSSSSSHNDTWYALYVADFIDDITMKLSIPRLGEFGIHETDLESIAAASGIKSNPVAFTPEEKIQMLKDSF
jgi:alcohol dehydrogenase class IV